MNRRNILIYIPVLFSSVLISCGTSTGSRYAQEQIQPKKEMKDSALYSENFDLTRYHSKFDVKEKPKPVDSSAIKVWYSYNDSNNSDTIQSAVKTLAGYRVLVLSTDNLDDANNLKSEVYFKTDHAAVYVIFDPPFYKVEAGDFTNMDDANNFSFKLKQMGYNEVRVVSETINKFK
jgi:cell division septation protein DedD